MIEFSGPTGKTFTAQRYDLDGTTIGTAIACTEIAPTIYRFSTTQTSICLVVATAGNARVSGYVDPTKTGASGHSELGNVGDTAGLQSTLDEINAKLTAEVIQLATPVTPSGTIDEIIIGDDYLETNGRHFQWDIDIPTGFTLDANATTWFGGKVDTKRAWLVQGTITLVSGKWRLKFDLPRTATENLEPGVAEWSVEVRNATAEITRVKPSTTATQLVEKYT